MSHKAVFKCCCMCHWAQQLPGNKQQNTRQTASSDHLSVFWFFTKGVNMHINTNNGRHTQWNNNYRKKLLLNERQAENKTPVRSWCPQLVSHTYKQRFKGYNSSRDLVWMTTLLSSGQKLKSIAGSIAEAFNESKVIVTSRVNVHSFAVFFNTFSSHRLMHMQLNCKIFASATRYGLFSDHVDRLYILCSLLRSVVLGNNMWPCV